MNVCCKECNFWDDSGEETGLCRRKAPDSSRDGRACWPWTDAEDWCGEFQPLPVQQKMEVPSVVAGQAP